MSPYYIYHQQIQCDKIITHSQQEINTNENQTYSQNVILTHTHYETSPISCYQNLHWLLTSRKGQLTIVREISITTVADRHLQIVAIEQILPATAIKDLPPVINSQVINIHQPFIKLTEKVIKTPLININSQHLANERNLLPQTWKPSTKILVIKIHR